MRMTFSEEQLGIVLIITLYEELVLANRLAVCIRGHIVQRALPMCFKIKYVKTECDQRSHILAYPGC